MFEHLRAPKSYIRYLAAKKSVDDRALNHHVWTSLGQALPAAMPDRPLRVLEVGAGTGSMIQRMVERSLLTQAVFTALDLLPDHIAEARRRLSRWAVEQGFQAGSLADGRLVLESPTRRIVIDLQAIDVADFLARRADSHAWDLLVAHACLDELDLSGALPPLLSCLEPGGLCYFTINFDGATILQPTIDPVLDAKIEALYHQTMDDRLISGRTTGGSRTGRHLFGHLRRTGVELVAAGSSDWVVFAGRDGYPADEAYFLHFILDTIHRALDGHPDLKSASLADWIAERHAQIDGRELVYIAHQIDVLGRIPAPDEAGNSRR